MSDARSVHTTCNRDCPDACGLIADVENGRVVALRGDPDHPVTQGFLCYRTSRFPKRQYDPARITKPLLRRGDRQIEIPLDEALDIAAEKLVEIKKANGPAAILHYRSGGSLGMLKVLADYFFELFGPTCSKIGDICSGAGDAAQQTDFGREDSNDVFDLLSSRRIINWGKNIFISNVHLIPILKQARANGAEITLIDPVRTRSTQLADRYLQVRPDGDSALALAAARILFESGRVAKDAEERCDHFDAFKQLVFARPMSALLGECDLDLAAVEALATDLAEGPTAILVGWGLGRRLRGSSHVRLLDALSAISGNLGRKGGGVSFYFKRRGAFDVSFKGRRPPPRRLREPLLGQEILEAKDPPIRAIWVTCGNPVAMLPDSATVARAFEKTEFSVVVDSFPTDTTRRATLVLPTTTLLEDDDLLGAYGHHYLAVSRPVIPAPPGVLTDLQIFQELAKRVGLEEEMRGTPREWKLRMLERASQKGASLERLEKGPVRNPFAEEVLFADQKVDTASGRVNLIHALLPPDADEPGYPLHLFSNSTDKAQSSQWATEHPAVITATLHPRAANGVPDGALAKLVSAIGALTVRIAHDPGQRPDLVIIPKGGHFDRGGAANALIRARATDDGDGAAYQSARVRVEPV